MLQNMNDIKPRRGITQNVYFPVSLYDEMVEASKSYPSLSKFIQEAVEDKIIKKEDHDA